MMRQIIASIVAIVLVIGLSYYILDELDIGNDKEFEIKISDIVTEALERAYFEGQRNYAEGDIRIQQVNDSCWVWSKSPWEDGSNPIYNPLNCNYDD